MCKGFGVQTSHNVWGTKLSILYQLEIAKELDKLSAKLDDVDEMISSAMTTDPQVHSLLSGTADLWLPVITATADERRNFTASIEIDSPDNAQLKGSD